MHNISQIRSRSYRAYIVQHRPWIENKIASSATSFIRNITDHRCKKTIVSLFCFARRREEGKEERKENKRENNNSWKGENQSVTLRISPPESRIFQVSQDLFDSFDSCHLFRNFQFSCDSLPRNPSFLPPAEDKKWRWLINGSAREEPSSGFQLRDVKTRLSPSSSLLSGEGEPVSLLSRLPLHSWPRISRRRTENPPLPLPIVGLFCPVSPGRAMRYLWVSFGGLCRSRHYTGRQPSPLGPSSPLYPI